MDGKNCTGRKISLLNDSGDVAASNLLPHINAFSSRPQPQPHQLPRSQHHSHHHYHHHHYHPSSSSSTSYHSQYHTSSGFNSGSSSGSFHSVPTKIQLPPLTSHSRTSSCSSTPSLSPQTPQLVRSSSSDSRGFSTPSPLTPSFAPFSQAPTQAATAPTQKPLHLHVYGLQDNSSSKMEDTTLYPPVPDASNGPPSVYPMPTGLTPQMPSLPMQSTENTHCSSDSPSSEPSRVSTVSNGSNAKHAPKKNQYPCPMAKQVGCNDFFTTSGHAARHAKKHTGKKDAFCPECNKAFTRKDNMEQHRRTHQNGRGASRTSATNDDAKVKKNTKQPAKKLRVEPQLEAAVRQELVDQEQQQQQQVAAAAAAQAHVDVAQVQQSIPLTHPHLAQPPTTDSVLMMSPAGPYFLGGLDTGPIPALPMAMPDLSIRPPLLRNNFTSNIDYICPSAIILPDDALHYSYPSPGLSNGLNSLALAASEHRRLSEEKLPRRSPSQESTHQETPTEETP